MNTYMNNFGLSEIVVNPPAPLNKKGKSISQKKIKDNLIALVPHGWNSQLSEGKCRGVHFSQRPMVQVGK